ncbi:MAG: pyridoxamine 5'-phosphate oxidase family protein [Pseudomonadota bacterium]|jgi:nitroimidazol reductase NimA-like FMN-containing flavoprotein (pyridoxamine 5'-phosphate oxidase superfamily)
MAPATDSPPDRTARHRVRRHPERANYDRDALFAVLDAAFLAHVAFTVDGQPFAIPMLHARDGERVLLHGSVSSRLLAALAGGAPCCLTVTVLDGLVLARSQFAHSVNYRSAVVFGRATEVTDPVEKARCLWRITDAIVPGRAADSRVPDASELEGTRVLALSIEDASVKVRSGGPKDRDADLALPHWAGVVPLALVRGVPQPAPGSESQTLPAYLAPIAPR